MNAVPCEVTRNADALNMAATKASSLPDFASSNCLFNMADNVSFTSLFLDVWLVSSSLIPEIYSESNRTKNVKKNSIYFQLPLTVLSQLSRQNKVKMKVPLTQSIQAKPIISDIWFTKFCWLLYTSVNTISKHTFMYEESLSAILVSVQILLALCTSVNTISKHTFMYEESLSAILVSVYSVLLAGQIISIFSQTVLLRSTAKKRRKQTK